MMYNYNLQRQPKPAAPMNTAGNLYDLQRRAPVSQGQQLAEQQNTQGLQTGQFADVQSAQGATDRANALRTSQALQASRGTFARAGGDASPEAASRAQDQAFSAAEAQNINGTNAVNQLQRQYRTDAITQAGNFEKGYTDRQSADTNTIGTLGNIDLGNRNATTAEAAQKTNQQNADTSQYGTYGNIAIGNRNAATAEAAQGTNQFNADTTRTDVGNKYELGKGSLANDVAKTGNDLTIGLGNIAIGNRNAATAEAAQGTNQFNADTTRTDVGNKYDLGKGSLAVDNRNADTNQQNANTTATDVANKYDLGKGELAVSNRNADVNQQTADTNSTSVNNVQNRWAIDRGDTNTQTQYQHTLDQINAISDPKAKSAALAALARGEDVSSFISNSVYNSDGSIQDSVKSASPGSQTLQATMDQLKTFTPRLQTEDGRPETDEQYNARITKLAQAKMSQDFNTTSAPGDTATKTQAAQQAADNLNNGKGTPQDFQTAVEGGTVPKFTSGNLPIDEGAAALVGKTISLGGKQFSVVANGRVATNNTGSHMSYVVVQDPSGQVMYNYNGQLSATPPVTKGGEDLGKSAVYNPNTKTVSYVGKTASGGISTLF